MANNTQETKAVNTSITISPEAFSKARKVASSEASWKWVLLAYLKNNQGCTQKALYKATRADDLPEAKMKKNLASQFTYLRDEGAFIENDNGKIYALTEPVNGSIQLIPGMESRAKRLGLIK